MEWQALILEFGRGRVLVQPLDAVEPVWIKLLRATRSYIEHELLRLSGEPPRVEVLGASIDASYLGERPDPAKDWGPREEGGDHVWALPALELRRRDLESLYDGFELAEMGEIKHARENLTDIVARYPLAIDAYHHLGNLAWQEGNIPRALKYYEMAVRIGRLSLPERLDGRLPWGILENRPFLRACHGRGLALMHLDRGLEAAEAFDELLRFNPDDNQGVRYLAPPLWLAHGAWDRAGELLDRTGVDGTNRYTRALIDIEQGRRREALRWLCSAIADNRYVISMVLGLIQPGPPGHGPGYRGSFEEASEYLHNVRAFWTETASQFLTQLMLWPAFHKRFTQLGQIDEQLVSLPAGEARDALLEARRALFSEEAAPGFVEACLPAFAPRLLERPDPEVKPPPPKPKPTKPRKKPGLKRPKHNWAFTRRFRRHAFGWRSKLPIQRVREAVREIEKVAKDDPLLAGEGAVYFLERVSPAIEQVDGSSGGMGAAVHRAIETLVPLIIHAPANDDLRDDWLERLWAAIEEDDVPYLEPLTHPWGELCVSAERAGRWAERLLPPARDYMTTRDHGRYFKGRDACLSALVTAGRHEDALELLEHDHTGWWLYRQFGAMALAALGRTDEALAYAEASEERFTARETIADFGERILREAGRDEQAYQRFGLELAQQSQDTLAAFAALTQRYPDREPGQVLDDLLAHRPETRSRWFPVALQLKRYDLAHELAEAGPSDPRLLSKAAKEHARARPELALAAGIAAVRWLAQGHGTRISQADRLRAVNRTLAVAYALDREEATRAILVKAIIGSPKQAQFMKAVRSNNR